MASLPKLVTRGSMSSKIEEIKQKMARKSDEKRLEQPRERKRRFDMRKKVQRSIADLTSILTEIGKLDSSENDYALIFRDEKPYFRMLNACNLAYSKSFKSKAKLRQYPEELFEAIQLSCIRAKIKVPTQKQRARLHLLSMT
jgi:hypothetical protein